MKLPDILNRNLLIIFSITLIAVMGVSSITPAFPAVKQALGLSNQQVGLLITFFSAPGIILTPAFGILSDRIGRKVILVPSLVLYAISGTACFLLMIFNGSYSCGYFRASGLLRSVHSISHLLVIFFRDNSASKPWDGMPAF